MKKRAAGADRACRDLVVARARAAGRWQRQLRCTLGKTDAKGDYSVSEDDKDEHEEFPELLVGGLGKLYDFKTGFVKFLR